MISENGELLGVLRREEALKRAQEEDLDLVLISPNEQIPIAKIIDWSKFKYEKEKKLKKSQNAKSETKEWWFKPHISDYDINVKLNKIKDFFKKGITAKITIKSVRGSNYTNMRETIERILKMSEDFATPISEISGEGRNLSVIIKKLSNKNEKTKDTQSNI